MKKTLLALSLCAAIGFGTCGLASCNFSDDGKLDIVCTTFPQYDWVRVLTEGDENVNLTVLQTSGIDLHNFQPSAADIVKIYGCDLFLYVGGESDKWVGDVLSNSSANPDMVQVKLIEKVAALTEEEVPGSEEEHDHDQGDEEDLDEHVWLSLKNAEVLCEAIADALCEVNPDGEELYRGNLEAYKTELSSLEAEFSVTVETAQRKTILFGDRFPFRYLAEDYGLTYFAAFSGCAAETEASFSVITNLSKAVDDNNLPYILVLEGSDKGIAEQIKANTTAKNQEILVMNSIQSVTTAQINGGTSYLSLMRENLNTLKKALN